MACQMVATAVTFSDLEGHSLRFQMQSVEHLCSILHDFHWQYARMVRYSALAELLLHSNLSIGVQPKFEGRAGTIASAMLVNPFPVTNTLVL